jgi:hypothetical protein
MDEIPTRLSNVVRFEIPAFADVDELCSRLRPHWPGSQRREDGIWNVSARFRLTRNDLAVLLRTVEAYVADEELQAIRYRLDGRYYILEAVVLDRAAAL